MKRALTGFVGAVLEAWQELRIHRTRVLLSLIGVAVAVCSLTTVVALGAIVQQANEELSERSSGRPATLYLSAYSDGTGAGGSAEIDGELMDATWAETLERYDVTYGSRVLSGSQNVGFVDGIVPVGVQAVDQPYGEMHRVRVSEGAWFTPGDALQLAPRLIVNQIFWERIGSPDLATHPTVKLGGQGAQPTTIAVVTGVTPVASYETEPSMFMLVDQFAAVQAADPTGGGGGAGGFADPFAGGAQTQYEMWVPPALAEPLIPLLQRDFTAALGEGVQVDVFRQDFAQYGDDPFLVTKLVVGGIAVLVLLLGALGLVNIALVTVKQRVREIGIRRSFGATAGRVFFAVMMESVVATVAAGIAGVVAAVLIVQSPWVRDLVGQGMITDFPPFPVDAALLGLVAATAVGALAGLLPALVAVRVKVIDAIRY
ncbi:ABC transporter permease [Herbiconiux sp. CPCC 203407]|uniref:ABC transporter permease n=1 Tax=Herbiconiux oxytropis TaxID=2970915 RepID=A0AA41XI45_9MICO|nr:ABC transporter permease [Herbiconiux oxytropis]MCS5723966.1 ABC transporter permease [Herbiconiux oxytropis]MCS5726809.1 ABC transporter permease [Herbiconiux oxytropis]